jgi:nitrile hydratase subunit beta
VNGAHDLGGMHGFGKVNADPDEPVFGANWERRILAIQRTLGYARAWHIDMFRDAQEHLPPNVYHSVSYYERWILAVESNLVEHGLVDEDELALGHSLRSGKSLPRILLKEDVSTACARGSFARQAKEPSRFAPGHRVRARNIHPPTHTRLPRYARGRVGTIEAVRGCHVFPDSLVTDGTEDPQWLYTVVFTAQELWGETADVTLTVSIEAFEPYLVAA